MYNYHYEYLEIPNDDYWVIEDFHIYKVKVVGSTFNDIDGIFSITFLRFIDRFDVSPMLLTKTISAEAWPLVFHTEKHNAMIVLVKMLMKLDLEENGDTYYCDEYEQYFDKRWLDLMVDEITNEYPDKFI